MGRIKIHSWVIAKPRNKVLLERSKLRWNSKFR